MKIHATRIAAPSPGNDTGTKWQVAVTYSDGNTETFDRVEIYGNCKIVSLPDNERTPHVFIEPAPDARIQAFANDVGTFIED